MRNLMTALKPYLPVLVMVFTATLQAVQVALEDSQLNTAEVLTVTMAVLGAVLTYVIPRVPQFPWAKTVVSAISAGVLVLLNAAQVGSDFTPSLWLNVAIQLVVGLGGVALTEKQAPLNYIPEHAAK